MIEILISILKFTGVVVLLIVIAAIFAWLRGEEPLTEEDRLDWQENQLHIFKEED